MLTQNPEMLELERGLRDHWIPLFLWGSRGPKRRRHARYWFKGVHKHTHSLTHMLTHSWPSVLSKFSQGDSLIRRRGSSSLYFCILFYLIFSQLHQSLINKNCIYISGVQHDVLIYGYVVKWLQSSYLTCPLTHIVTFMCVCDGNTKGVFS